MYSTNNIVAMQILTSDVMQELIEFKQNNNMEFDVAIRNNNLYLRFSCGEVFEPAALRKGPIEEKSFSEYFEITKFTYELSNKIINVINDVEI